MNHFGLATQYFNSYQKFCDNESRLGFELLNVIFKGADYKEHNPTFCFSERNKSFVLVTNKEVTFDNEQLTAFWEMGFLRCYIECESSKDLIYYSKNGMSNG